MTKTIGTEDTATRVAQGHLDGESTPMGVELIGSGSQRHVYADFDTDTVYKLGDDSANRHEVRVLTEARNAGKTYAPEATLYTVDVLDTDGEWATVTVVAMPYLPDDGSVDGPYPILAEAADLNPHGNVHANGGQLWLIDAGGL